ncbi:MAG TPA: hypothetical protein DCS30_07100 [Rhizobiales bacterium]|nr:hypothetical protein [Hyphomicrobiales bacterium]
MIFCGKIIPQNYLVDFVGVFVLKLLDLCAGIFKRSPDIAAVRSVPPFHVVFTDTGNTDKQ